MTKKVTIAALFVLLAFALVWAGTPTPKGTMTANPQMDMMKAEMMKCAVCKNVAMHMDEIGPMGMEAVQLNDGMAVRHWVKNPTPARTAAFHTASTECKNACDATMNWTDEQAKTGLCDFCQGVHNAMKAGAHMSMGDTKSGNLMVMTSTDPAVQAQLTTLHEKCAMMAASMDMPMTKTSAEKK